MCDKQNGMFYQNKTLWPRTKQPVEKQRSLWEKLKKKSDFQVGQMQENTYHSVSYPGPKDKNRVTSCWPQLILVERVNKEIL